MQTLTTEQLKSMIDDKKDLALVNTLSEDNFDQTRIPGSVNIPQEHDSFVGRVEKEAGGKDKTIVVYCASTDCGSSEKAAKKLEEAGFEDVYDYEAGAKGWQEAGETLQMTSS